MKLQNCWCTVSIFFHFPVTQYSVHNIGILPGGANAKTMPWRSSSSHATNQVWMEMGSDKLHHCLSTWWLQVGIQSRFKLVDRGYVENRWWQVAIALDITASKISCPYKIGINHKNILRLVTMAFQKTTFLTLANTTYTIHNSPHRTHPTGLQMLLLTSAEHW